MHGKSYHRTALVTMSLTFCSTSFGSAVSILYVTEGGQAGIMARLQGSNVLSTWTPVGFDYPIAVNSTIRATGGSEDTIGGEYDLVGNFLGNTFARGADGFGNIIDGTTDGTFNYAASFSTGEVIRFDADWSNPAVLFNTGNSNGGITYDPTGGTLWVADFLADTIAEYQMDGTLIGSFQTGLLGGTGSLALDHADGTLWFNVQGDDQHTFHQFSKDGTFLSSESYTELIGLNILGGEFQIPEPSTAAMLAVGTLVALRRRRD